MASSEKIPFSISRMAQLGLKGYQTEVELVSAQEQASQYENQIFFVEQTKQFYLKKAQTTNHISDYVILTSDVSSITSVAYNGVRVTVASQSTPPTGLSNGELWIIQETGVVNIWNNDIWNPAIILDTGIVEYVYDAAANYEIGDVVLSDGQLYVNTTGSYSTLTPSAEEDLEAPNWYPITKDTIGTDYDFATIYEVGDIVNYEGNSYYAIQNGSVPPTSNSGSDYWQPISSIYKNSLGRWRGIAGFYNTDDLVNYEGEIYKNLTGTNDINTTPNNDATNWVLVQEKNNVYPEYDASGGTTYNPGDTVNGIAGSSVFVNIASTNQSPSDNPDSWQVYAIDQNVLAEYRDYNHNSYVLNDIINYNGILYRNITGTVDPILTPDSDTTNWIVTENTNLAEKMLDGNENVTEFMSKLRTNPETLEFLQITNALADGSTIVTPDAYEVVSKNGKYRHRIPIWSPISKYTKSDVIAYKGAPYINISGNNSLYTSPYQDTTNWFPLKKYNNHYVAQYNYDAGDVIYYNGVYYTNLTGTQDGTGVPSADAANWQVVVTDTSSIRYFSSATEMAAVFERYGSDWVVNDLAIIYNTRALYYYTGDSAVPFRLMQNSPYTAIAYTWEELMTVFPANQYMDSEVALVRSSIGDETPEYSVYYSQSDMNLWRASGVRRNAVKKTLVWNEWNTKWQYLPAVRNLPVGSAIHIVPEQDMITRVENWDPSFVAWDNGANISREKVFGMYSYMTGDSFFDDVKYNAFMKQTRKHDAWHQKWHGSTRSTAWQATGRVSFELHGKRGNGWMACTPEYWQRYTLRVGQDFIGRPWADLGYDHREGTNWGSHTGGEDMPFRYLDAPWWNLSNNANLPPSRSDWGESILEIGNMIPGMGTYFYGYLPDFEVHSAWMTSGLSTSYRFFNSKNLKYDGAYEVDKLEYNWYKDVPGSEILRGLPRPNTAPKVYGSPTSVLEADITDHSTSDYNLDDSDFVLCVVKYRPTEYTKEIFPNSYHDSDNSFNVIVTASTQTTEQFSRQEPDSSPYDVSVYDNPTISGRTENYVTGRLQDGLFFNNKLPRVGETYDINGVDLTVYESDLDFWEFWDVEEKSGKYWKPSIGDASPWIRFQLEDATDLMVLSGINIMPCAPYGKFDSENDGIVSEFHVDLYDSENNLIRTYTLNTLKDSLREYAPNSTISSTSNLAYQDCTMMLNNRDYRAYRNTEYSTNTVKGDTGIEFRAGQLCKFFIIRPVQWHNRLNWSCGRIVPIFSRWSKASVHDSDGNSFPGYGNLDVASKWVKVGNGIQVNQTNSWRRVSDLCKPNEKVAMRDRMSPDITGLKRYTEDIEYYRGLLGREISVSSLNSFGPELYDNRFTYPEGSDTNFYEIEAETLDQQIRARELREEMEKAAEMDKYAMIMEITGSIITCPLFTIITCGATQAVGIGLQVAAAAIVMTVGTMDETFEQYHDDEPGQYGGKSEGQALADMIMFGIGVACIAMEFMPPAPGFSVGKAAAAGAKTVGVASKAGRALKMLASVCKSASAVAAAPGLLISTAATKVAAKLAAKLPSKVLKAARGVRSAARSIMTTVTSTVGRVTDTIPGLSNAKRVLAQVQSLPESYWYGHKGVEAIKQFDFVDDVELLKLTKLKRAPLEDSTSVGIRSRAVSEMSEISDRTEELLPSILKRRNSGIDTDPFKIDPPAKEVDFSTVKLTDEGTINPADPIADTYEVIDGVATELVDWKPTDVNTTVSKYPLFQLPEGSHGSGFYHQHTYQNSVKKFNKVRKTSYSIELDRLYRVHGINSGDPIKSVKINGTSVAVDPEVFENPERFKNVWNKLVELEDPRTIRGTPEREMHQRALYAAERVALDTQANNSGFHFIGQMKSTRDDHTLIAKFAEAGQDTAADGTKIAAVDRQNIMGFYQDVKKVKNTKTGKDTIVSAGNVALSGHFRRHDGYFWFRYREATDKNNWKYLKFEQDAYQNKAAVAMIDDARAGAIARAKGANNELFDATRLRRVQSKAITDSAFAVPEDDVADALTSSFNKLSEQQRNLRRNPTGQAQKGINAKARLSSIGEEVQQYGATGVDKYTKTGARQSPVNQPIAPPAVADGPSVAWETPDAANIGQVKSKYSGQAGGMRAPSFEEKFIAGLNADEIQKFGKAKEAAAKQVSKEYPAILGHYRKVELDKADAARARIIEENAAEIESALATKRQIEIDTHVNNERLKVIKGLQDEGIASTDPAFTKRVEDGKAKATEVITRKVNSDQWKNAATAGINAKHNTSLLSNQIPNAILKARADAASEVTRATQALTKKYYNDLVAGRSISTKTKAKELESLNITANKNSMKNIELEDEAHKWAVEHAETKANQAWLDEYDNSIRNSTSPGDGAPVTAAEAQQIVENDIKAYADLLYRRKMDAKWLQVQKNNASLSDLGQRNAYKELYEAEGGVTGEAFNIPAVRPNEVVADSALDMSQSNGKWYKEAKKAAEKQRQWFQDARGVVNKKVDLSAAKEIAADAANKARAEAFNEAYVTNFSYYLRTVAASKDDVVHKHYSDMYAGDRNHYHDFLQEVETMDI